MMSMPNVPNNLLVHCKTFMPKYRLEEAVRNEGGEKLMLKVDTKKESAVKLYEKLGYEKQAHLVKHSSNEYRDWFIMCKYIS